MICKSYDALLNSKTETLFIAELLHAVTHDEHLFKKATGLINEARNRGVFEGVVFHPSTEFISEQENNTP
jgi:hypothetical protein